MRLERRIKESARDISVTKKEENKKLTNQYHCKVRTGAISVRQFMDIRYTIYSISPIHKE